MYIVKMSKFQGELKEDLENTQKRYHLKRYSSPVTPSHVNARPSKCCKPSIISPNLTTLCLRSCREIVISGKENAREILRFYILTYFQRTMSPSINFICIKKIKREHIQNFQIQNHFEHTSILLVKRKESKEKLATFLILTEYKTQTDFEYKPLFYPD